MSHGLKPVLARLAAGQRLDEQASETVFSAVMDGAATQAQIGCLLTALHLRGESVDELTGAVRAMRARMLAFDAPPDTIDVCGTGGDGLGTLNVSTAAAFILAACGVRVAKHGNRALSSRAGGADVLSELGLSPDLPAEVLARQLAEARLCFLFAPRHHPALRHAAPARAELGFRTLFNLIGPLCSPARVGRQLTGVYSPDWLEPMARVLGALGAERAWLVHGQGLDELTLAGETQVAEWRDGRVRRFTVMPEQAGLGRAPVSAIAGGDPPHNAAAMRALLRGAPGAYRDTVVLNAAAALVVAGRADDLREGAGLAAASIDGGGALHVLDTLVRLGQQPPSTALPG